MSEIKPRSLLFVLLLGFAGLISISVLGHILPTAQFTERLPENPPLVIEPPEELLFGEILDDPIVRVSALEALYVSVFERVSPSVVHIIVRTRFGGGTGTGFIWDDEGHIVTNNHVIAGGTGILVRFSDGTTVRAQVVGADEDNDLAVLKTDVQDRLRAPVSLGDSSALKVGQIAIALGNPYGFEQTLTTGIVSALGRDIPREDGYALLQLIQTDTAINPGNSGGPLLNSSGEVIGVATLIYSPSGSSAGVGFAVPVNTVRRVVPQLIEAGHFADPWIGIQGQGVNPFARILGDFSNAEGLLVEGVVPDSPADLAGVRIGQDIILEINGSKIDDLGEFTVYLAERTRVGETIELTIQRGAVELILPVTLVERPVR
jgi:2-alkenal reductase